jgi:hypothetical protein
MGYVLTHDRRSAVRTRFVGLGVVLVLASCGGTAEHPRAKEQTATAEAHAPAASATVITFRRVRYEGATLRTLYVHADGSIKVDVPGGGAGGAKFEGRLEPGTLRAIRRDVSRTPWSDLSHRRVVYDRSGAYFILRHRGVEHVAMADGMSPDLVGLVDRLNGVLNGEGRAEYRVVHRFGRI